MEEKPQRSAFAELLIGAFWVSIIIGSSIAAWFMLGYWFLGADDKGPLL